MASCPYCSESVKPEARICRHCQRNLTYEVKIKKKLTDRQIYELMKRWPRISKKIPSAIEFISLRQAQKLFSKPPVVMASELSLHQSNQLIATFKDFGAESNLILKEITEPQHSSHSKVLVAALYAAIAFMSLTVLVYLVYQDSSESPPPQATQTELDIDSYFRQQQDHQPFQPQLAAIDERPRSIHGHPNDTSSSPQGFTRQQMQRLLSATVYIRGGGTIGSGFFISQDGYILSNRHVTENMREPEVILVSGEVLKARKVSQSDAVDLSLLKVSGRNFSYLPMGDASRLYPAQQIITIGNPSGLSFTVTRGIVSAVSRTIKGVHYIQTDAAINPGNSGGPMINQDFEVVGINTLTAKVEKGISFALPINYAYQSGGIAEGIGNTPPSSPSFQASRDPLDQSFSRDSGPSHSPSPQLPQDHYSNELRDLREQYDRKQQQYNDRIKGLESELRSIEEDISNKRANISAVSRLTKKRQQVGEKILKVLNEGFREDGRYYDKAISILKRAKGDDITASRRAQLDSEIQKIQSHKKTTERQNEARLESYREQLQLN